MKKLVFLSVLGLMSIGSFASNETATSSPLDVNLETGKTIVQTVDLNIQSNVLRAQIVVNCEDGSSYTVTCDSCTTSQLIGIAVALCS